MKKNSKWLALLLAGAMTVSPLSYVNAYAAEADTVTYSVEAEAQAENGEVKAVVETPGQTPADTVKTADETKETSAKEENKETNTKTDTKSETKDADKENKQTDAEVKDTVKDNQKPDTEAKESVKETEAEKSEVKESDAESEPEAVKETETDVEETETAETTEGEITLFGVDTQAPVVTGDAVRIVKDDGSDYKMCVVSKSEVNKVDDKLKVTFETGNVTYSGIYFGTKDDENKTPVVEGTELESGGWFFAFEADTAKAGQVVPIVLRKKDGEWATKTSLWMYIPAPKASENPDSGQTPDTGIPEDAVYSIEVESSSSMFKVVNCELTVKSGKMTAIVTLSGTGYGYLYAGTGEQAASADQSAWIAYKENANGEYTYELPVEALDKGIAVAAYSIKNEKWYDRELTFKSETMKKIGDVDNGSDTPNPDPTPTPDPTPDSDDSNKDDSNKDDNHQGNDNQGTQTPSGNDGKADNESKYESDTSGSTSRVDSSTGIKDGVYTPDRFTWSGGTGKVKISCNKVTIKSGQAYATLVFSSNHYQYVKANGNTYYTTKSGNTATVTIPIALNKNNTILGMTDKMSAAHEIQYSIFVYLAAANTSSNGSDANGGQTVDNKALAEKAPEIMGLEYESETKLEYAEYFKIYHYDQGIVLLEIDMTKDTARDAENNKASDDKASKDSDTQNEKPDKQSVEDKTTNAVVDEEASAQDSNGVSEEELAAELYKGNIVNYLLVPEGVEVPVGLEQDMIIVNLPADKTYAASEDILETMKDLDLLDNIAAVGMEKDDCSISEIADKMEAKDGEDAEVAFGGLFEQPDLKALVKQETNLALLPAEFLPMDKEAEKDSTADGETTEDGSDEAVSESTDSQDDLTVEEQEALFEKVTEKFAMLGIPVIVDRSSQEKTDLAKMEWIKVYGVLYGCEDQMNKKFDAAVKAAEK